jgi:hypothetical protein
MNAFTYENPIYFPIFRKLTLKRSRHNSHYAQSHRLPLGCNAGTLQFVLFYYRTQSLIQAFPTS